MDVVELMLLLGHKRVVDMVVDRGHGRRQFTKERLCIGGIEEQGSRGCKRGHVEVRRM